MTVISYPIPAESNPPVETKYYQPSVFDISAITLGKTTVVTTSKSHNYVIGNQMRLIIPSNYGSRQLNEQEGYVISIPSNTEVEITINSRDSDAFAIPSPAIGTKAQIMAIGDINSGIISSTGVVISSTNIPGSFINIS